MRHLNQASVKWVSRVSETSTEARTLIQEGSESWQQLEDGTVHWFSQELDLPQGRERWVVVYTQASLQRAQQSMQRQVSKAQTAWEQKCWHLGKRRFACWIVGTNVLEQARLSDQQLIATYKGQGGAERGFRFLKDPLFLASSVFVKKPERIMALSFIMVLCEARSIA
jgi:transposase